LGLQLQKNNNHFTRSKLLARLWQNVFYFSENANVTIFVSSLHPFDLMLVSYNFRNVVYEVAQIVEINMPNKKTDIR
jgi:hypothetical protein